MKKTLLLLFVLLVSTYAIGQKFQAISTGMSEEGVPVFALQDNSSTTGYSNPGPETDYMFAWVVPASGATSGLTRIPGNTYRFQRTEYIVTPTEMAASGFPSSAEINSIGWIVNTAGTGTQTGTLNIWLMNTTDATYTLGGTWTTAGFTLVHSGSFTVPITAGAYEIPFSGGSTFTYTGGGVYVAWEFSNPVDPLGTAGLAASCNNSLATSLYGARDNVAMPTALGSSAFRPATSFGNNFYTDILAVNGIWALEKTPIPYGAPVPVHVRVSNNSASPATFNMNLVIKDATNTITRFTTSQLVSNLAANTETVVTIYWTPTIQEDIKITGAADAAPGENFIVNNTLTIDGTVNNNLFGYIYNMTNPPGAVGWSSPLYAATFANRFEMKNAGIVTGANLAIGNSTTVEGQTISAVVLNKNGQVVAQSDPHVILLAEVNTVINLTFPTPPNIAPEEFYVGLATTPSINASAYYPMGYWGESPSRPNAFYRFELGGSPPVGIAGYKFGIEAQVAAFAGVVYPRDLTAVPVSNTQIDLSWLLNPAGNNVMIAYNTVDVFGTPADGTPYIVGGSLPGGGTVIYNANGTSFPHTGLSGSTTYFYRAWSVDGTNTYSSPANTSAATWYDVPYTQDFEVLTSLPVGWSGTMAVEALHGTSSSRGISFDLFDDPAYHFCDAISPHIVLSANTCKVTFDYRLTNWDAAVYPFTAKVMGPGDKVELQISTDHGSTWTTIYTINQATHVTSVDFANLSVTLTGYTGQTMYRIFGTWGEGDYYLDVDNFIVEELPLCPPPTNVNATGITINSAVIGWTGPSVMMLDYGPIGHAAGTGTIINPVTSNPYTLSPLFPGTGYDVYVRQECSPGIFSPWAGPATFTTLEILQITPNPYDFGPIALGTQSPAQVFTIQNNGASAIFIDGVWIAGPDAGQFILSGTTGPYTLLAGASYTVNVVFNPASTGVKTANLIVSENETEHPVPLTGTGVCPAPTALTATNITTTAADLGWTANGTTAWEIEWGPFGFTQGAGTMITAGVTNPYPLTGLNPASAYSFYVRGNCGNGNFSEWVGPYSFATLCLPFSLPFTENFDATTIPNIPVCWTRYAASSGTWVTATNVGAHSAPNSAAVYYHPTLPKDMWLVSPAIMVNSGLAHEIRFWVKAPGYLGTPEKLELVMSTDPSFAAVTTAPVIWDGGDLLVPAFTEFVVSFMPTSSGPYYFAWHAYSVPDVDYIAMDDITIQLTPVPENLGVEGIVANGVTNCYNASNTITVPDGGTFTVEAGGSATFIAGQKVVFMPGATVEYGGIMHAYISTSYCAPADAPFVATGTGEEVITAGLEHIYFSLFPNPTTGNFTLVQKGDRTVGNVKVEIFSMRGERVLSVQMVGEKQREFVTSSLPTGLYFVKVVADDYTETIKLIKTR